MRAVQPSITLIQTEKPAPLLPAARSRPGGYLPITALIAVKNEEANIGRCLSALTPAKRVVVIDSGSEDGTERIAREAGAEVIQFRYRGGYPKKRQWALDHLDIDTEWVFLLDADEMIPPQLWEEVARTVNGRASADAYLVTKGFHFLGRRFRFGGFSHAAILLFRTGCARFENMLDDPPTSQDMEVHERLLIDGRIGRLKTPLIHQDFKGLESYLARHNLYSTWEAKVRFGYLTTGKWGNDSVKARLFGNPQEVRRFLKRLSIRTPFEPQLWFVYHFLLRLGFLEGRRGLLASRIRSQYVSQIRAKLYELHACRPRTS